MVQPLKFRNFFPHFIGECDYLSMQVSEATDGFGVGLASLWGSNNLLYSVALAMGERVTVL